MISGRRRKRYVDLEKKLERKFKNVRENELSLTKEDFKDGTLKASAFVRLKDECWYIPYEDEVLIKLPEENADRFKNSLEFFASRELSKIKKDRREAQIHAAVFFLTGVLILGILTLLIFLWGALDDVMFVTELITIISWVFVWAAVTKFFIDRKEMRDQRYTLLQLLSAKIESGKSSDE
jgi:hypothetical protein